MVNGSEAFNVRPSTATYEELEKRFEPITTVRARKYGTLPGDEARKLINKQFIRFEPDAYINFPRPGGVQRTQDLYIDRALHSVIEQMSAPMKVSTIVDPVMGVFRTSVLTLSTRWQIYNTLGGALQASVAEGFGWLPKLKDAHDILKYLKDPTSTEIPAAFRNIPESLRLSMSSGQREILEQQFRFGQSLGEITKGPGFDKYRQPLGTALSAYNKGTSAIVNLNSWVDNAYRLAVHLSRYDKEIARFEREAPELLKGANRPVAHAAAMNEAENLVMKTMYTWDAMTPGERQVMRGIFPFYGFMSHVSRFAWKYAVDHPVRLAVTAGFARNEINDWQSGLPERLRSLILTTDENGDTTGINLAGWNPFGDIANTLTLTGWLSQVNPLFSTLAEQFGIDPRTGQANLYPSSQYDPVTGRLQLATRNPATALLENLIPQTQVLTDYLGYNRNISDLERSDPDAARRLQLSAFGVPNLFRSVDLPGEAMRSEGARENAYKQALSDVLANPGTQTPYPTLNALSHQILTIQSTNPAILEQYTPAKIADIQTGLLKVAGQPQ